MKGQIYVTGVALCSETIREQNNIHFTYSSSLFMFQPHCLDLSRQIFEQIANILV
jgi:hypothetical protein